jgi:hypothetical protein
VIKLNFRGSTCENLPQGRWVLYFKTTGLNRKVRGWFIIIFELRWTVGWFLKAQGSQEEESRKPDTANKHWPTETINGMWTSSILHFYSTFLFFPECGPSTTNFISETIYTDNSNNSHSHLCTSTKKLQIITLPSHILLSYMVRYSDSRFLWWLKTNKIKKFSRS